MNLFVARLNSSTSTKDLQKLFSHYGLVTTVKVIFDHDTGRSKCYGFAEMPDNNEAHEAMKELDETLFRENIISVRESQASNSSLEMNDFKFRSRSSTAPVSGNNHHHSYFRNPFSIYKTNREINGLRNFGYRGDNRTFR